MADSRGDSKDIEKVSESSSQDQEKSSQKPNPKRNKIPKFEEKDMYKIKYDF